MTKKREEIIEDKIEDIKVVETSKKKTPVALIIVVSVIVSFAIILSAVLPFLIVFGFLAIGEDEIEFKTVEENKIEIPSKNTTVEKINDYYDKEDECYVLQFKVDREGEIDKKKSGFFDIGTTLEVRYIFKDKDDYVIGEEVLTVDDFDSNNKVKKNVYYCDDNAKDVEKIEAKEVTIY